MAKDKVFSSVSEMFDAIRDENGVLKPTLYTPNGNKIIHLAESQDSLQKCIQHSSDKQDM
jgi:hypothetical protein